MANNPATRLQQWARFLEAKGWLSSTALPGILGAVSQTAGVPTGAIIESGTNSNGSYTKFADGTMICRHTLGGVLNAAQTWTFPSAFSTASQLRINITPNENNGDYIRVAKLGTFDSAQATFWSHAQLQTSTTWGGSTISHHVVAIGRWF